MACNIQRIRLQKQMKLQILNRPKTASRDQVDPLPRGGGGHLACQVLHTHSHQSLRPIPQHDGW